MAYWRLFYHFVWTTKNRDPLLTPDIETNVYRFLHSEAKKMYVPLFVVNGMPDHVHVLAAVRPAVSPADFMKQLKGSSSRFVTVAFKRPFEWQVGYGVLSVSEKHVPHVIKYIERQKEHHAENSLYEDWERADDWNEGPADTNW
ncbi:MAG: IS200/IS605 family transposase [Chloroflexi bacterium]|nr:IS200/IS605 family transposase [Chloroflexota bacterium]MCI0644222.1 IS200/IS605 family transposase [Chloroflexota bacterium]MCI0727541.1 IS200/IS605 family transposase [Chloroflexota bacterium]